MLLDLNPVTSDHRCCEATRIDNRCARRSARPPLFSRYDLANAIDRTSALSEIVQNDAFLHQILKHRPRLQESIRRLREQKRLLQWLRYFPNAFRKAPGRKIIVGNASRG